MNFLTIFEDFSQTIRETIESSEYADMVYTMDVSALFVTDDSYPISDTYYYADSMHINHNGYVKLFIMNEIQEFFGCDEEYPDYTYKVRGKSNFGSSSWSPVRGFGGAPGPLVTTVVAVTLVSLLVLGVYVVRKKEETGGVGRISIVLVYRDIGD